MRTTLDLPDPVFRDLKSKAAREGVTMKELLTGFVEKGLYESKREAVVRSPLPTPRKGTGTSIPGLTNAEIDDIFMAEDLERFQRATAKGTDGLSTPAE